MRILVNDRMHAVCNTSKHSQIHTPKFDPLADKYVVTAELRGAGLVTDIAVHGNGIKQVVLYAQDTPLQKKRVLRKLSSLSYAAGVDSLKTKVRGRDIPDECYEIHTTVMLSFTIFDQLAALTVFKLVIDSDLPCTVEYMVGNLQRRLASRDDTVYMNLGNGDWACFNSGFLTMKKVSDLPDIADTKIIHIQPDE